MDVIEVSIVAISIFFDILGCEAKLLKDDVAMACGINCSGEAREETRGARPPPLSLIDAGKKPTATPAQSGLSPQAAASLYQPRPETVDARGTIGVSAVQVV